MTVHRALAPRLQLVEFETRQVMDEICLPHVQRASLALSRHREWSPSPSKCFGLADALGKGERIVKDEIEVVIEVDGQRRIVGA